MAPALQSYFSMLASERKQECVNMTVISDNAHIPLGEDYLLNDEEDNMENFSQSLSALNTLSFPPPFLDDESVSSRWDSMESPRGPCNEADFPLHKPSRTRDEYDSEHAETRPQCIDKTVHQRQCPPLSPVPNKRKTRRLLKTFPQGGAFRTYETPRPSSSLDSVTRWLRELPLEAGDLSPRGPRRGLKAYENEVKVKHSPPPAGTTETRIEEELLLRSVLVPPLCRAQRTLADIVDPATSDEAEDDSKVVDLNNKSRGVEGLSSSQQLKLASQESPDQMFQRSSRTRSQVAMSVSFMAQFPFVTSPFAPLLGDLETSSPSSSPPPEQGGSTRCKKNLSTVLAKHDAMDRILLLETTDRLLADY
jgi:hypothetical protein